MGQRVVFVGGNSFSCFSFFLAFFFSWGFSKSLGGKWVWVGYGVGGLQLLDFSGVY